MERKVNEGGNRKPEHMGKRNEERRERTNKMDGLIQDKKKGKEEHRGR